MSILIVNTLYSVFANHLVVTAPIVEFRFFIDDAKFWAYLAKRLNLGERSRKLKTSTGP